MQKITITNIAKDKLINLINKQGVAALLYLKGGGCNGFSYKFKILKDESKVNKLDEVYKLNDNMDSKCGCGTSFNFK